MVILIILSAPLTTTISIHQKTIQPSCCTMDSFEDHICPACRKYFSTIKGVHSHLTSSKKCSWYKKRKLKQIPTFIGATNDDEYEISNLSVHPDFHSHQEQSEIVITADTVITDSEIEPQEVMEEIEDLFHFIPLPASVPEIGKPGSSSGSLESNSHHWTSIQLEDHENDYYVETSFPEAGYIVKVDESLHLKWKKQFGHLDIDDEGDIIMQEDNEPLSPFAPFASELDWRVASWAINDGIGHKSFDRLLSIPGVRF